LQSGIPELATTGPSVGQLNRVWLSSGVRVKKNDQAQEGEMVKTILVADDNPAVRKTLCRIFEVQEGYGVCGEAANGREAIEVARKHKPDLIILDLSMPDMSGIDAANKLKSLMPHVPIILFTQYSEIGDRIGATNLNVDRIVSKGNATSLMGHVRALAPVGRI
jgi:two-component system, NarL family, invasion response regulator UvrY